MKLINAIAELIGAATIVIAWWAVVVGMMTTIMMVLGGAIGRAWNIETLANASFWNYSLIAILITTISLFNLGGKRER